MTLAAPAQTATWTYVEGDWYEGNVALLGPRSHAMWLASCVFDGARWFEGVAPDLDLHAKRVNSSAIALGLKPTMTVEEIVALTWEGLKKFDGNTAVYIRPMYWAEHGGYMAVPADPASTRFCLCLYEAPMISPTGFSITVSPFRRPSLETMPTNAKAGCLYPNNGRAILEAKMRGFDNALVLDMLGNVAETGSSNIFLVKDGHVLTPAPNGTFLSGITKARTISLLADYGFQASEKTLCVRDFLEADEIFSTGNHSKVVPVTRIEDRHLQPGPVAKKARELYWEWAHRRPLPSALDKERNLVRELTFNSSEPFRQRDAGMLSRRSTTMAFELPPLPYDYEALQPFMSKETLEYHHDKHHKAYVDNGNKLAAEAGMGDLSLTKVVKQSFGKNAPLFNNAAQHYNHIHFWKWLKKGGGGNKLPGALQKAFDSDLGGYDKFKADFIAAGTTQFGSGWAWVAFKDGKLSISKTPNGENPLVHGARPILGVDVWEHSYYIDYRNARPKYLEAFVDSLINWDHVLEMYEAAKG